MPDTDTLLWGKVSDLICSVMLSQRGATWRKSSVWMTTGTYMNTPTEPHNQKKSFVSHIDSRSDIHTHGGKCHDLLE